MSNSPAESSPPPVMLYYGRPPRGSPWCEVLDPSDPDYLLRQRELAIRYGYITHPAERALIVGLRIVLVLLCLSVVVGLMTMLD